VRLPWRLPIQPRLIRSSSIGLSSETVSYCGPPCAHSGVKNVYTSEQKVGLKYPNGTVVVKTVAQPSDRTALPNQVAVMRKVAGKWRYVEYVLSGSRYTVLGQGSFCASCHARARANDYVFTTR